MTHSQRRLPSRMCCTSTAPAISQSKTLTSSATVPRPAPAAAAYRPSNAHALGSAQSAALSPVTTKVHHAVDSLGFVHRLLTSQGQCGDCTYAEALTVALQPLSVVGDKGYDTDKLRAHWQARGIGVCIPPKSNRVVHHLYNKVFYRTRHMVENSFCRLKDHRRLSLRLDKTDTSFRAFACFAAALMNLKLKIKLCP